MDIVLEIVVKLGNAQSTAAILMGFHKMTFIYSHHLIRLEIFLIRVFGNLMDILFFGFQILRLFVQHLEFVQEETSSFRFI